MIDLASILLIVFGLVIFEIITSIDNAVINAEVLRTMSAKAKRWFLSWGILSSVFLVRGVLPWLIIWATNPALGPVGAFTSTFSNDPKVYMAIEMSAPPLLMAGGIFLLFLFLHWLFMEPKYFGLRGERFIQSKGVWFFAIVSVLLAAIVWFAVHQNPLMAFGAVVGSTAFFIVHGFKQNAEQREHQLLKNNRNLSDISKILYLEVIDATFSIDGVLGAFAFTLAVPLILIGNGIGAIAVRQITMSNIENVKKYKYLKNGAMYSIFVLGCIMLLDSFGFAIPPWLTPISTFIVIGYFFWKSRKEPKKELKGIEREITKAPKTNS
jgi:hypothetical protein